MTKALLTLSFISILIASPVLVQSRTGFSAIGGPSQAAHRQLITRQLQSYADSVGVDVSSLRVPVGSDTLYTLLHELRYGQRPRYLSHLALTERIDSAGIQRVLNLLLLPGSDPIQQALSEFIPIPKKYLRLLSHYQPELANLMLEKTHIDNDFLNRCLIDAKPGTLKLPRPFPVFILYQTADLDQQGNLRWHPNVYDWIQ